MFALWEEIFVAINNDNIDLASLLDKISREYVKGNRYSRFIEICNGDGIIIDVDQDLLYGKRSFLFS